MSKITNDVLIRFGTGCFMAYALCTHMATVGVKGLSPFLVIAPVSRDNDV